jgi:hypothetical protein
MALLKEQKGQFLHSPSIIVLSALRLYGLTACTVSNTGSKDVQKTFTPGLRLVSNPIVLDAR